MSICVGLSLNGTLNLRSPPEVMLLAGPVLTLNPPTSQYMEGLVPSLQLEIKRGEWGVTPRTLCRPSSLLASFSDLPKYSLSGFLFVCMFVCFLLLRVSSSTSSLQTSGRGCVFSEGQLLPCCHLHLHHPPPLFFLI